jgi:uncharacterized membrane protein
MVIIIIQTIAIFLVPIFILRFSNFFITKWIGTIGTAYLLGIIVALLILLFNTIGLSITLNTDVGEIGSHVAIALGIPLLLFGANLMETKKLSKVVLKSFLSLIISAIVVSSLVFAVYAKNIENGAELSGMAIGLYTGGTPNLNAIAKVLELNTTIIGAANLSDMMIGAMFYLFLLILCKPLLSKFLKSDIKDTYTTDEIYVVNTEEVSIAEFKPSKRLLNVFLVALMMVLISALLGIVVWQFNGGVDGTMIDYLVPVLLIGVTVFGIIGSFNKPIRDTRGMNVLGQYFILVFSFALASSMDFSRFAGIFGSTLILYGTITLGVFILHVLISKFMKVDVDCTMVTLTAGLYGPAFVPAITKQIKNDSLTAPGLIVGSIGYAIGTFLGIGLAYIYLLF